MYVYDFASYKRLNEINEVMLITFDEVVLVYLVLIFFSAGVPGSACTLFTVR